MAQPIPKKISDTHVIPEKNTYTLFIDGDSLLQLSWNADTKTNTKGQPYGGVFQFLLQLKILLSKRDFDFAYVAWDEGVSGQLRHDIYPEYKENRHKNFSNDNVHSDYYDQMDAFMKRTLEYSRKNKEKIEAKLTEKEDFHRQKAILQAYLEELFIRQVSSNNIEGDDHLAYYCLNKKSNDLTYLVSGDMDVSQLINEQICIYIPRLKKFISTKNFSETFGYNYKNVALRKILCGDTSDNIKGVKGLSEDGLMEIMPEIATREVYLWEVIARAKEINQKRIAEKKKPFAKCLNIINQETVGMQGKKLFEINEKIINLKKPLLTPDAIEQLNNLMYSPIDPDGRSLANLYKLMLRDGIDELINENKFATFFSTFSQLRINETKMYEKWVKENN